jgi:hypothetical protein
MAYEAVRKDAHDRRLVGLGLGRILALHPRWSTSNQIR